MALFKSKDHPAAPIDTEKFQSIQVLGLGCANCHTMLNHVKFTAKALGIGTEVEYITDMEKIAAFGVMQLPALVVNGQVLSAGRVLRAKDAEDLLRSMST